MGGSKFEKEANEKDNCLRLSGDVLLLNGDPVGLHGDYACAHSI